MNVGVGSVVKENVGEMEENIKEGIFRITRNKMVDRVQTSQLLLKNNLKIYFMSITK